MQWFCCRFYKFEDSIFMKKLLIGLFTAVMMMFALSSVCTVSAIGQTLNASYGTPVIDGSIDKIWYKANRTRLTNLVGGNSANGRLPSSSSAYVSVMYDDEAIYFLFEIKDDDFTFDASGKYKNDKINVFIDEKDVYGKTWQNGQRMISLVPNGDTPITTAHGKAPKYSKLGYRESNGGYVMEYKYVPTDFEIEEGAMLLCDFSFCDIDENGNLAYLMTWSDELGEGEEDSSNWAYIILGGSSGTQSAQANEAAEALGLEPIKSYEFVKGSAGNHGETADLLWDGNVYTKFCTSTFPVESVVKTSKSYYVTGVLMATANDTKEYQGRNPNKWSIDGSKDGKSWTEIVTGDDSFFENVNYTYFSCVVESDEAYSYFRFRATGADAYTFQLSEVVICGSVDKKDVFEVDSEEMTEVPGGTIFEQTSPEYEKEASAEEIVALVADDDNSENTSILVFTTVFLVCAVVVIIFIQSDTKKKKK